MRDITQNIVMFVFFTAVLRVENQIYILYELATE